METRQLTENLSVCGQIRTEDIPALAAQGFRTLICNRPDAEDMYQQPYAEIAAAAKEAGMEAHYLPVVPGDLNPNLATEFAAILERTEQPALAYCRTGTRSAMLWQQTEDGARRAAG